MLTKMFFGLHHRKMKTDVEKWFKEDAEKVLREVGIKKGNVILDFGCGEGIYSLPAAKIAGKKGKVFALDKSISKIDELIRKAKSIKLENVETVKTSGKLKVSFPDGYFDAVLLYDILHSYYFSLDEREKLLEEIRRVLRVRGLLSVYPEHMDVEKIRKEIEKANFRLERKYSQMLIHEGRYTRAYVLSFRKRISYGGVYGIRS